MTLYDLDLETRFTPRRCFFVWGMVLLCTGVAWLVNQVCVYVCVYECLCVFAFACICLRYGALVHWRCVASGSGGSVCVCVCIYVCESKGV